MARVIEVVSFPVSIMNDLFSILHRAESDDVRTRLASNVRRLRIARHLSLSELARTTTVSKATLSGIERGGANPTVDTLAALGGALGVSIGDLLEETTVGDVRIVRASPARATDRFHVRVLEASVLDGQSELREMRLPAHHLREEEPQTEGSRARLLVLHGKLVAGPVERVSELAVGDYASFPTDVSHLYETPRHAARALMLAYTPR
jgi:transcriptional regulator with XRE-family HTH domain